MVYQTIGHLKEKILIFTSFFFFFCLSVSAFALPDIQILSPQNTTYSSHKVLVNVTSSEKVDFYIKSYPRNIVLASDSNTLETYLYVKKGTYNFTIYANNSNGTTSSSVSFTVGSSSPPVELTECGLLFSPDTEYLLINDVSGSPECFTMYGENNTLDLNGKSVTAPASFGGECKNSKIFNGSAFSSSYAVDLFYSSRCIIRDLEIFAWGLAQLSEVHNILFERVYANVTDSGLVCMDSSCDITTRNSTFEFGGGEVEYPSGIFMQESCTDFTTVKFENTVIKNFPYQLDMCNLYSDYYLRNTNWDISGIIGSPRGFTRFYVQHLLKVNVSENGTAVPAKVDILDNSTLPKVNPEDVEFTVVSNPTANLSIATNDDGVAEAWLTEKLIVYTSFSPTTVNEYKYSPYILIAKGKDANQSQIVNITGNSTFRVNFNLTFPKLPPCTLDQMFDVNNDGSVNINDAIIVLRRVTGLPVYTGAAKKCEARNFFPIV